ncbi:MAG: porin [Burkholderiaceae bacterium]|nr:porin [Burkholderiaceae bacterium]
MKSSFVIAAAALAAGSAFAQGSTEIYGRFNLTAESQKLNGVKDTGLYDNSSRIGIRGTEDLGGGLKAGYVIEHGFNADTGAAAGAMWGRESTVSLGGSFGTFRFGNMPASEGYFATADYVSMHNHDTGSSADALYGFVAISGTLNSAIAYTSPTVNGLRFDLQYGMKENTKPDAPMSVAVNYDAGAMHLGLGYEDYDGQKSTALRGLYEMGAFTVGGYYERGSGNMSYNNFRVAGMYTMGASEFHLNLGKRSGSNGLADGDQFTVAYNYNLSKRTRLHVFYTSLDLQNGLVDFSSYGVGLRHNF